MHVRGEWHGRRRSESDFGLSIKAVAAILEAWTRVSRTCNGAFWSGSEFYAIGSARFGSFRERGILVGEFCLAFCGGSCKWLSLQVRVQRTVLRGRHDHAEPGSENPPESAFKSSICRAG